MGKWRQWGPGGRGLAPLHSPSVRDPNPPRSWYDRGVDDGQGQTEAQMGRALPCGSHSTPATGPAEELPTAPPRVPPVPLPPGPQEERSAHAHSPLGETEAPSSPVQNENAGLFVRMTKTFHTRTAKRSARLRALLSTGTWARVAVPEPQEKQGCRQGPGSAWLGLAQLRRPRPNSAGQLPCTEVADPAHPCTSSCLLTARGSHPQPPAPSSAPAARAHGHVCLCVHTHAQQLLSPVSPSLPPSPAVCRSLLVPGCRDQGPVSPRLPHPPGHHPLREGAPTRAGPGLG